MAKIPTTHDPPTPKPYKGKNNITVARDASVKRHDAVMRDASKKHLTRAQLCLFISLLPSYRYFLAV